MNTVVVCATAYNGYVWDHRRAFRKVLMRGSGRRSYVGWFARYTSDALNARVAPGPRDHGALPAVPLSSFGRSAIMRQIAVSQCSFADRTPELDRAFPDSRFTRDPILADRVADTATPARRAPRAARRADHASIVEIDVRIVNFTSTRS